MHRIKKDPLTEKQRQVIQLAVEGNKWDTIASVLNIKESTISAWRQDPVFVDELNISQERYFNEVTLLFKTYVTTGFAVMHKIATNKEEKYSEQYQYKAAKELISLPFTSLESIKLLEHNRNELNIEKENKAEKEAKYTQLSLPLTTNEGIIDESK
jgi:hypothetical protein